MIQKRSVALSIVLSIVTCGIYGLYWIACVANDVNTLTNREGTSGGMVVLLSIVTCGIYQFYWFYKVGEALDGARAQNGVPSGSQAIVYLLLSIFGFSIVSLALAQSELNKYEYNG